ncbi:ABC transporter substrate-binding protein [Demequina aurantiaca]|uniref:ABC transporter substrate-binding protein n=1 Tax=Demequina aurantiaca TaxID=676200 RepID=UPI0007817ACB|nr:extracellular solute-binding protein [Demequina aurantiaca]
MKSLNKVVTVGAVAALAVTMTACSSDDSPEPSTSATDATTSSATADAMEPVTIKVVSLIPGSDQAAFDAFDAQVAQFEGLYPNITVESEEYEWTGPTFAAQLAGGTLPDVYTIPFTDGLTLLANGQLANITSQVSELPYANDFNPNVLAQVQDANGDVFGLPTAAYGSALHYNRALFTEAGLDPDQPPTTWDEVREDAKAISDKTGNTGFAQMAASNTGGWQLTVATYARGGRMQTEDADGKIAVTADNDATKAALDYFHQLRWEDDSMGSDFLLDWGTINQAFGAGQVGMYTSGSDIYTNLIQAQGMNPDDYGATVIPLEGDDSGTLGGGTIAAVNVKASPEVQNAAVKWIDFYYMQKLVDQDAAVLDAKTLSESDQAVGVPALPIFSKELFDQSREWVADYINVDQDHVSYFNDAIFDQAVVPEPKAHTQELYAALDTVVQSVLTDENADTDALLKDVNVQIQALIDADA